MTADVPYSVGRIDCRERPLAHSSLGVAKEGDGRLDQG